MKNFTYVNPTRILFGKGQIAAIGKQIPESAKVLVTYGGGSIKANGVYDQVMAALKGRAVAEFGGIEPNPSFETMMRAADVARAAGRTSSSRWAAVR
jgi:NADP-dependent alcohol dehydrogenase